MSGLSPIALIGFGEFGQILAADLAGRAEIAAWDIAFVDPQSRPSRALAEHRVRAAASATYAVAGARLAISAVTAAQDLEAARAAAAGLANGAFFLDLNSCSPGQKLASAEIVEAAGGRYVEAAVMSPILPTRIGSPMLLGGPHAEALLAAAKRLGFDGAQVYSQILGRAAATKLCRSVVVKGVEALLTESLLAARHYGGEGYVLASLSNLLPLPDWPGVAQYMISRALEHGVRRAEEMREAARTVEEAGVQPLMSCAIAERQDWAGSRRAALAPDLFAMLDALHKTEGSRP